MANVNNAVTYRNFDRAMLFGLKEGQAKYVNIVIGRGGEGTKIFACKGDYSYEAGSQLTTSTFLFGASTVHSYVGAVESGRATQKRLLLVLPDDCGIRYFEIRKAMNAILESANVEEMEFDDIVDKVSASAFKPWMGDEWKKAIIAFTHAYLEAISAGIDIGVMKHTNLYSWELRSSERNAEAPFSAGDKLTLKNGIIEGVDGWYCENNKVSGEDLEVSVRTFGNGEGTRQVTRYYVPRAGEGVDISNLRKADKVLRDALPHRQEAEVVEASDF